MKEKTIRAGLHIQKIKIGRPPEETKEIIKKVDGDESLIEVEGLDLTPLQYRAVHAIQTLLHQTDYKGHVTTKKIDIEPFHMEVHMPILKIRPADYLEAFGCQKKENNGRRQYSSNEKQQAMDVLKSLYEKRYILYYRKKIFHKDKKPEDRIVKVNMPLIGFAVDSYKPLKQSQVSNIIKSKGQTKKVSSMTADKRIELLTLEVSPIFVDQIDSYFMKKPINYLLEIKEHYPKASKYVYNFIEYILTRAAELKGKHIQISKEKLAVSLRMNKLIETHQKKRINQQINQCYDVALRLGYITSHATVSGKTMDCYDEIKINYKKLGKLIDLGKP